MQQVGWKTQLLRMVLLLGCCFFSASTFAHAQSELAFKRVQHLRRGINLSMWYAQSSDYSAAREASYTTPADFKLVHDLGFDHVRLSLDPVPLTADPQAGTLNADAIARLDETVKQITSLGLVVVLDIHPETPWKHDSTLTDDGTERFFRFWKNFAQHYAVTDPDKVYFEVLNEPEGVDGYRWAGEQARVVAIVRAQAPKHTIIATATKWGSIDGLIAIEPVRDENVIYTFHDYEPMEFTHQGATWAGDAVKPLRGVPYPSSPAAVAPLLPGLPNDAVRKDLAWYGEQRWSAERMQKRIAQVVDWAKQRHVPLWCGEFGVYRAYAPVADRARWIDDLRTTLEKDGVGWCMWDYQASFGMVTKTGDTTVVDEGIVQALGLKR